VIRQYVQGQGWVRTEHGTGHAAGDG
jgi:hypothetical protein